MFTCAPSLLCASSGPTDPFFANVSALLHFDGPDGSTTFTDVTGKSWTAVGNAQIDTAQFKFGGSSGLFDGSGDYVDGPASADFQFGTGDFTIEGWCRYASGGGNRFMCGWHTNWGIYLSSIDFSVFNGSANIMDAGTGASAGVQYYLALTRSSGVMRFFIDGVLRASVTNTTNFSSTNFRIGAQTTGAGSMNGHIDDLRVTKGICRYTASFTPPTAPFPDS